MNKDKKNDNGWLYLLHQSEPVVKDSNTARHFYDKSFQLLLFRESVLDGTDGVDSTMSYAMEVVDYYLDAIRGDHIFQAVVGYFFYEGKRVEQDYKEAFHWCLKAAEYGIGMDESMYLLGRMYELGKGVEKDSAKAVDWYLKAAAQENVLAIARLSELL